MFMFFFAHVQINKKNILMINISYDIVENYGKLFVINSKVVDIRHLTLIESDIQIDMKSYDFYVSFWHETVAIG
jgi:hypothetical protein